MGTSSPEQPDSPETSLLDRLSALYEAEHRLADLFPRLADRVDGDRARHELRREFRAAIRRLLRLEAAFRQLGSTPRREGSRTAGIPAGKAERLDSGTAEPPGDPVVTGTARRVRRHVTARYPGAAAMARDLGRAEVAALLVRASREEPDEGPG